MQFEKISAPSLKDLFVRQLRDAILSGELPIGTQLPVERELARQMQVSRAVVNGGLSQLAADGFLEVRPRQGTFVADYRRNGNMNTLIAIMEFRGGTMAKGEIRAILEVRRALEHLAAGLAIEYASAEDMARLAAIVDELAQAGDIPQATGIAFRFQHELAFVSGNSILPLIYYSFRAPVMTLWARYCRKHGVDTLYHNTARLFEHIRARDKAGADAWIDSYLNDAIQGNRQIYVE